jgi:excisionase family DNA binding protein
VVEVTTLRVNGPGLFSLTDAADVIGLPVAAVRELIDEGQLRAVRVGSREVITAVSISELLADLE